MRPISEPVRPAMRPSQCRRHFLRTAGLAGAVAFLGPWVVPSAVLGRGGVASPNDRLGLGFIGLGGWGGTILADFLAQEEVQMVAICDVQARRREAGRQLINRSYGHEDCAVYSDLRELLARPEIDAVVIATGDHWHATASILAARAGKDVYCEPPLSLTLAESRAVADATHRWNRIFQYGTQRRSQSNFQFALHLARQGYLGDLRSLYAERSPWFEHPHERVLPAQPEPPREALAWDLWLGPAAWRPFNGNYLSRGFWSAHLDFAGGSITEGGSHTVDLCQAALGTEQTSGILYEPAGENVTVRYANGVPLLLGPPSLGLGACGVRFEGTEGWVMTGDAGRVQLHPKSLHSLRPLCPLPHASQIRDFIDCVKTRRQPVSSAAAACSSITTCHAANLARRLGRPLRWDPRTEMFVNDDLANRLRARAPRPPWCV